VRWLQAPHRVTQSIQQPLPLFDELSQSFLGMGLHPIDVPRLAAKVVGATHRRIQAFARGPQAPQFPSLVE
jgi:hypothetical protein